MVTDDTARLVQRYCDLGWYLVPIHRPVDGKCGCGHPWCSWPGKHTHLGLCGARPSNDPYEVIRWLEDPYQPNLAVQCGAPSGVWLLDVDLPNGPADLAALEKFHGELPPTPTLTSGSGGKHYYFRYNRPLGSIVRPNIAQFDIKATGGHGSIPPSVHFGGQPYRWEVPPWSLMPPDAPPWLIEFITTGLVLKK